MRCHHTNMTDVPSTFWGLRGHDPALVVAPQSILVEIGLDDLPRWEKVSEALRAFLVLMNESTGRRHRKMEKADWDGWFTIEDEKPHDRE